MNKGLKIALIVVGAFLSVCGILFLVSFFTGSRVNRGVDGDFYGGRGWNNSGMPGGMMRRWNRSSSNDDLYLNAGLLSLASARMSSNRAWMPANRWKALPNRRVSICPAGTTMRMRMTRCNPHQLFWLGLRCGDVLNNASLKERGWNIPTPLACVYNRTMAKY